MALPSHTLVVRDYSEARELIQAYIDGFYDLMVLLGDAGTGKSEMLERRVFQSLGRPNQKWAYIKGRKTPLKLYETLYHFRHFPIVINDVDTLFKDEINVSLLKCVCDTGKVKHVQWDSSHSAFTHLPTSFDSISRVLIITNSWEKVSQNITALHNRGVVILFRPTALEVHREVAEGGWFEDRDVWEFIGKNLYMMVRPDLRFYIHARNHKRAGRDWKELTLRMMASSEDQEDGETDAEQEKQIYVARLLADPKYDELPAPEAEREKVFAVAFPKGGSRATYHRQKQKLLERRGNFDQTAVAAVQWQGVPAIPTVFDVKQEQRRAALEKERQEIEKAGGVPGFVDDEEEEDGKA